MRIAAPHGTPVPGYGIPHGRRLEESAGFVQRVLSRTACCRDASGYNGKRCRISEGLP